MTSSLANFYSLANRFLIGTVAGLIFWPLGVLCAVLTVVSQLRRRNKRRDLYIVAQGALAPQPEPSGRLINYDQRSKPSQVWDEYLRG